MVIYKMDEYKTILEEKTIEIVEKKSRFIANIFHIENSNQAEEVINKIKKKYYDARHNCIAYRIKENDRIIEKSSDDGEPSGTAGSPMLNILQKNDLCDVIVIVTRYFGGILLGTGGLVRAYSEATINVIKESKIVLKVEGLELMLKLDYSNLETFRYYCKKNDINIIDIEYLEDVIVKVQIEKKIKSKMLGDIESKALIIKDFQELKSKYINKAVEKNK